jgi:polyisoprenoid-binding protein YceI
VAKALGAEKAPVAVFTLEKIKSASAPGLEPNVPVDVVAEGTFELNGVRKKIEVPARVTFVPKGGPFSQMRPGNFVRLSAQFDVKLADFGVERRGPVLPLQVGESAHVTVAVLGSDASAEEAKKYRDNAIKYMGKAAR